MDLDVLFLSRLQFALTVMFHYLFPPLTIGLGAVMVFTEGLYLKTRDPQYEQMTRFWTRLFGVNFAMGVATGIVMEFQFGTNWSQYSRFVGDVFGSALAAEGIFAFFLESGFLAILVFGWDRVSPRTHFFSTCMVALGSIFSAVWIVVANSWQQTPAGFHIVTRDGMTRAEITDFWAVVFNPSSMVRLGHVILGAFLMGAFFVMSITAWYILKNRHVELSKKSFRVALIFAAVVSVLQFIQGDNHGRQVGRDQPAKLAAFEGLFQTTTGGTPLLVFGIPDEKAEKVHAAVGVPGALSFLVHRDFSTPVAGLDKVKREDRPPVLLPFATFHTMIALGTFFIALTFGGLFFLRQGTLFQKRWLMWVFVFAVLGPYVANQAGWVAAEVGRQPWAVYGLLRTSDSVSTSVPASHILISIIVFGAIYAMLMAIWIMVMNDKIQHGPESETPAAPAGQTGWHAAAALGDPAGPSLTSVRTGAVKEEQK